MYRPNKLAWMCLEELRQRKPSDKALEIGEDTLLDIIALFRDWGWRPACEGGPTSYFTQSVYMARLKLA